MSMENKLKDAETAGMLAERARCLWCIDEIARELHLALRRKLMSEAEIHMANVKFNIFSALRLKLRRAIITGAKPLPNSEEKQAQENLEKDFPPQSQDPLAET